MTTTAPALDTSALTPAMLGRLNKHLNKAVRYDGEVMTLDAVYALPKWTAKRLSRRWHFPDDGEAYTTPLYMLDTDGDTCLDVPKLGWDCIDLPEVSK